MSHAVNFPVIKSGGDVPWIFSLILQIFFPPPLLSFPYCILHKIALLLLVHLRNIALQFHCCAFYSHQFPVSLCKCHYATAVNQKVHVWFLTAAIVVLASCLYSSFVVRMVQWCRPLILQWRERFIVSLRHSFTFFVCHWIQTWMLLCFNEAQLRKTSV